MYGFPDIVSVLFYETFEHRNDKKTYKGIEICLSCISVLIFDLVCLKNHYLICEPAFILNKSNSTNSMWKYFPQIANQNILSTEHVN